MKLLQRFAPVVVGLLAAITFASGFRQSSFVFDDHVLIERNVDLRRGDIWRRALVSDYYATSEAYGGSGYYRPVAVWSNAVDQRLWKNQAPGFRLTNLILHALASVAAMAALRALGASTGVAWISALLFAVHPVHAESVAFVSGRVDILATLGMFAAMAFAGWRGRFAWLGVGIASLFAFLSKESSIVLPVLLALVWKSAADVQPRSAATRIPLAPQVIALGVAAGTALLLRGIALGNLLPATARAARTTNPVFLSLESLGFALGAVFAPLRALAVEPDPAHLGVARLVFGISIGAVLWIAAWRLDAVSRPLLRRALIAAGCALLPTLNLLPQETPLSERFLYLVAAFLVVPCGVLVMAGWRRGGTMQPVTAGLTVIAVLVLLLIAAWRAQFWKDDVALWQRAVVEEPMRAAFYDRLGLALTERRSFVPAEGALRRAVELDPTSFSAQLNLGVFLQTVRRPAEAIAAYRKALELQPRHVNAHLNLGMALVASGAPREALTSFTTAVRLKPDHPEALRLAGTTALDLGLRDEARRYLQAAVQLQPDNAALRSLLARAQSPSTPAPTPVP